MMTFKKDNKSGKKESQEQRYITCKISLSWTQFWIELKGESLKKLPGIVKSRNEEMMMMKRSTPATYLIHDVHDGLGHRLNFQGWVWYWQMKEIGENKSIR